MNKKTETGVRAASVLTAELLAYNCPKHGKQEFVLQTDKNNKKFCLECIGDFLEKHIKPLEEI